MTFDYVKELLENDFKTRNQIVLNDNNNISDVSQDGSILCEVSSEGFGPWIKETSCPIEFTCLNVKFVLDQKYCIGQLYLFKHFDLKGDFEYQMKLFYTDPVSSQQKLLHILSYKIY